MSDQASPIYALEFPPALHPETRVLVARFAVALAAKLLAAQIKHGFEDDWSAADWEADCRRDLVAHLHKGDPLDVAAYAAFCWHHG